MAEFASSTVVPFPLETVLDWHRRPGALTRISPEFAVQVDAEAYPPLAEGAVARMQVSVPGSHGALRVPFRVTHHVPDDSSFVDTMVKGPMLEWEHTHTFSAVANPTATTTPATSTPAETMPATGAPAEFSRIDDTISYAVAPTGAPGSSTFAELAMEPTLRAIFDARNRRLLADLEFGASLRALAAQPRNVLIAGASGQIGRQVAAILSTAGYNVRTLVRRRPDKRTEWFWNPDLGVLDREYLAWADVVIHLGGTSIARRFTGANRAAIRDSRVESTRLLALTMEELPAELRPAAFVCASAVGYYGAERTEDRLAENAAPGEGFLAEVCREWEDQAARVESLGVRRVSVRTGVVLSSLGGILSLDLPRFLLGLGGRLGSGKQRMAWVSLDDAARVFARAAMDDALAGPVNAVGPELSTQEEYAKTLAHLLSRPSGLPVPKLGPQVLLGRQASSQLALADQPAVPDKLTAAGYTFAHPTLAGTLASTLGVTEE